MELYDPEVAEDIPRKTSIPIVTLLVGSVWEFIFQMRIRFEASTNAVDLICQPMRLNMIIRARRGCGQVGNPESVIDSIGSLNQGPSVPSRFTDTFSWHRYFNKQSTITTMSIATRYDSCCFFSCNILG
jgi:hypothetical protein